jgi:hypothetical protein
MDLKNGGGRGESEDSQPQVVAKKPRKSKLPKLPKWAANAAIVEVFFIFIYTYYPEGY